MRGAPHGTSLPLTPTLSPLTELGFTRVRHLKWAEVGYIRLRLRGEGVRPNLWHRCASTSPERALAVEPQHVVLGQTQSADGGAGFEATMRAVPVIAMQPDWEFGGTLIGIQIRAGIRPLA